MHTAYEASLASQDQTKAWVKKALEKEKTELKALRFCRGELGPTKHQLNKARTRCSKAAKAQEAADKRNVDLGSWFSLVAYSLRVQLNHVRIKANGIADCECEYGCDNELNHHHYYEYVSIWPRGMREAIE